MRILSDFDGVMTHPEHEARRVREHFQARVGELVGPAAAAALEAELEAAMQAAPHDHGWRSLGRLTAFADEDPFIRNNGLAAGLDALAADGHAAASALLAAARGEGLESVTDVAFWAFEQMAGETRAGQIQPLDAHAAGVLGALVERGHEVVVVSNSSTQRVLDLLTRAGLDAVEHDAAPTAPLRVRGGARKFDLGPEPAGFAVGAFSVDVARPRYAAILREERPDVVIGDVFSLDLALPLHLARTEPDVFGGLRLLLRTRDYTPGWSKAMCDGRDEPHASLRLLPDLPRLPELLPTP